MQHTSQQRNYGPILNQAVMRTAGNICHLGLRGSQPDPGAYDLAVLRTARTIEIEIGKGNIGFTLADAIAATNQRCDAEAMVDSIRAKFPDSYSQAEKEVTAVPEGWQASGRRG